MADRSDYRSSGSRSYRGGYTKYRDDRDRGDRDRVDRDREDQGKYGGGGDKGSSAPPQRQGPKRYQEQRRDWKRRKEEADDPDKKAETQAPVKDVAREEPKDRYKIRSSALLNIERTYDFIIF